MLHEHIVIIRLLMASDWHIIRMYVAVLTSLKHNPLHTYTSKEQFQYSTVLYNLAGGASDGSDFRGVTNHSMNFAAGAVSGEEFTVEILNDNIPEGDEYFEITFTIATTGYAFPNTVVRVTIMDDDNGELDFKVTCSKL